MQFKYGGSASGWAVILLCVLLVSGCASQRSPQPEENLAAPDYSGLLLEDDGIPLRSAESKALLSTGDIDRNLSAKAMQEVVKPFKHYLHKERGTVEYNLLHSRPYIDFVKQVFRDKGLPEDLAYLACIESGYTTRAVSRSKAKGLWQFMPATGRHFKLVQDWWMDERYDPYKSTRAAAEYLAELYEIFHDWNLAVASYNAGPGKIMRAMEATGAEDLFTLIERNEELTGKLKLRAETIQYVPRFLAMCKLMRNADELGFSPAESKNPVLVTEPVSELRARPGTDLAALAQAIGMDWKTFSTYNPAFLRYITPSDRHVAVYVPLRTEARADALLRSGKISGRGWYHYTIVRNDTLGKISRRTGVPVSILRQANPKCEPLQIGRKLKIPGSGRIEMMLAENKRAAQQHKAAPSRSTNSSRHGINAVQSYKVRSGESLAVLARKHGVSLEDMRRINAHLKNPDKLRVGQKVNVPAPEQQVVMYTVRKGDTLWSISKRFNTSPDELRSLNKMKDNKLKPGKALRVALR